MSIFELRAKIKFLMKKTLERNSISLLDEKLALKQTALRNNQQSCLASRGTC